MVDQSPTLSGSRRSTALAAVGGILVVLAAGWLGIDAIQSDSTESAASSTTVVGSSSRTASPSSAATRTSATSHRPPSGLPECPIGILPAQAEDTVEDILAGGPFEFPDNDSTRFGNYEEVLPEQPLGYYREYTVITPGLNHRGPRRIVTGGDTPTHPESWFYTDDHYESFCEIPDAA